MIIALLAGVFVCVAASVTWACMLYLRLQPVAGEAARQPGEQWYTGILAALGGLSAGRSRDSETVRKMLFRAGHRSPSAPAVFNGLRTAIALVAGSVGALAGGAVAGVCCLGLGYLLPKRFLEYEVSARAHRLRRALPSTLDMMVLALEAGQTMDLAMQETAASLRRVYPDLCSELTFCALEMRAGTARPEALRRMAERCGEEEVRKLVAVLLDGERFGTSLGPALRTHAHYLRIRMRQKAQVAARKLTVKLVLPVFFLIFPAVLVVTLAPAYFQLRGFLDGFLK